MQGEIPNFIQILSLPTIFGILIKADGWMLPLATSVIVIFLLEQYFIERLVRFLYNQITDSHSILNRKNLDQGTILIKWKRYAIVTSIVFGAIAGFSVYFIP